MTTADDSRSNCIPHEHFEPLRCVKICSRLSREKLLYWPVENKVYQLRAAGEKGETFQVITMTIKYFSYVLTLPNITLVICSKNPLFFTGRVRINLVVGQVEENFL